MLREYYDTRIQRGIAADCWRTREVRTPDPNDRRFDVMVRLSGETSNQIFAELADWEQVLKDTSLAKPQAPTP